MPHAHVAEHSPNHAVVARASVVRRRLGVLVDRLVAAGGLDPRLLGELSRFLRSEALPAARAYEAELEARWQADGGPEVNTCPLACWKSDLTCPADSGFEALVAELRGSGYEAHHDEADAEALASLACVCGHRLRYVGFSAPGSYRAFGVCRSCGHWLEF